MLMNNAFNLDFDKKVQDFNDYRYTNDLLFPID